LIEPMKAWVEDRNEIMDIATIDFPAQIVRLVNEMGFEVHRGCKNIKFIRPTCFTDINGPAPSRKLWEGDVIKTREEYRVIYFDETYGQWFGKGEHSKLGLYLLLDAYGAKYAGSVWTTPELVSWYKEAQNG
jgi:hypothetical protein